MNTKVDLEEWYSKEDPWKYVNTIPDKIRRAILLEQIETVFSDGAKKFVLDAGCGEGYITKDVASKYNVEIDAFDISEKALATARKKNSHENISYFQLDLNDYLPDKTYDLIMCEETLYYLNDNERISAARKFQKAINPGGYLKVSSIMIGENRYRKYFTLDSIKELLANTGFELVSIMPCVYKQRSFIGKALYRLLEYMNKYKLIGPNLLALLVRLTLSRSLDNCYSISLLAKKI